MTTIIDLPTLTPTLKQNDNSDLTSSYSFSIKMCIDGQTHIRLREMKKEVLQETICSDYPKQKRVSHFVHHKLEYVLEYLV